MNILSALMRTARHAAHRAWTRLNQGWEPRATWAGCWKVYETICDVVALDEYGVRHDASVVITTNVDPSPNTDGPRICLHFYVNTGGDIICAVKITADQAGQMADRLYRARFDAGQVDGRSSSAPDKGDVGDDN